MKEMLMLEVVMLDIYGYPMVIGQMIDMPTYAM
jgi:hypothetical protein